MGKITPLNDEFKLRVIVICVYPKISVLTLKSTLKRYFIIPILIDMA